MPESKKRKKKVSGKRKWTIQQRASKTGRVYSIKMDLDYARGVALSKDRQAAIQAAAD